MRDDAMRNAALRRPGRPCTRRGSTMGGVKSSEQPPRLSRRAAIAALAGLIAGCRRSSSPAGGGAEDGRGGKGKDRLVSLSASTTETVFALGAGHRLVGRSRFCDHPPEVEKIPSVGGFIDPSFEAILGLAPKLVVGVRGPGGRAIVDRLERHGIETYFPPTSTMKEIDAMIVGLAGHLGIDGAPLLKKVQARRQAVRKAVEGRARPTVLLVFGLRPIHAAGPGSFNDEMLTLAGASNAIRGGARYPKLSIERVLALDPDVVIDTTAAAEHDPVGIASEMPGWKELRAVREGRVHRVKDASVLRPGPRVGDGIAALARVVHPEVKIP